MPIDVHGGGPFTEVMRRLFAAVFCSFFMAGCAARKSAPSEVDVFQPRPAKSGRAQAAPAPAAAAREPRKPAVTNLEVTTGSVFSVNRTLRFVVLDFGFKPLPAVEQRLSVYRQGQKVGEVKISGPVLNNHLVADLVAGEAQPGDEVREE